MSFKRKMVTDPNLFMKLVLVALLSKVEPKHQPTMMMDYKWSVEEIEPDEYHICGCHPVAARFDYFTEKTVIH